jgi:hypothetical protein
MSVSVIYFIAVLGLGLICVIIGFISGPNPLRKPVPIPVVPTGNVGGKYTSFDYRGEELIFIGELEKRRMDIKPNKGEDYQKEKEIRDVAAFIECCNAGSFKNLMPEIPDNERN